MSSVGHPPSKIANLAGRETTPQLSACLSKLDPEAPLDYRELAALLACEWARDAPSRVGLAGGQGAGKSTLGRLIEAACATIGLRICVLSLDDFYLSRERRMALGASVHPLLETRGPPGTHDMKRCGDVLERLRQPGEVLLPVFDKGLDDRVAARPVHGPFDLVLLEGWCVGAPPLDEASLAEPINSLEAERDESVAWRRYVNGQLAGEYAETWNRLDYLIYLRVPDLAAVHRWRLQQENSLPEHQRLDSDAVDRFVQYYERITRSMMVSLPGRADLDVELAEDHSIETLAFRSA